MGPLTRTSAMALALCLAGGAAPAVGQDGVLARLDTLEAQVGRLEAAFRDAVVLTANPCERLGAGWAPLSPAAGRFLLAANTPGSGGDPTLGARLPGDSGGAETMTLETAHTPPHSHDVTLDRHTHDLNMRVRNHLLQRAGTDGRMTSLQTLEPGGRDATGPNAPATVTTRVMPPADAFELMPPYFVVNACVFSD